ncbi:MAG: alpha-1,2-fucosyltransferase [Cetobacterium sp.]|uniref:alpha-1,2-fucosyltransferase n=1 Tax=Cetobacterium sp. TaxID=2071632 RepID=UPI003F32CFF5
MKIIKFHGGLGNQMFQYCLYKNLLLRNYDVIADLSFFKKVKSHNGFELEKIFCLELKKCDLNLENFLFSKKIFFKLQRSILKKIKRFKIYTFSDTLYDEKILIDECKTILYEGYWQSEEYFQNIKEEILKDFTFPEIEDENNLKFLKNIELTNSVSIHIRRGDYVGHPQLDGLAPIEYYQSAIKYIKKNIENPIFYIFSNDLDWCKENLDLNQNECILVEGNGGEKSYIDIQLMSKCKHNIIPNSSFSWWGAWLNQNKNKIVIAPERWFSLESKFKYDDIVPKNWIKLKNY